MMNRIIIAVIFNFSGLVSFAVPQEVFEDELIAQVCLFKEIPCGQTYDLLRSNRDINVKFTFAQSLSKNDENYADSLALRILMGLRMRTGMPLIASNNKEVLNIALSLEPGKVQEANGYRIKAVFSYLGSVSLAGSYENFVLSPHENREDYFIENLTVANKLHQDAWNSALSAMLHENFSDFVDGIHCVSSGWGCGSSKANYFIEPSLVSLGGDTIRFALKFGKRDPVSQRKQQTYATALLDALPQDASADSLGKEKLKNFFAVQIIKSLQYFGGANTEKISTCTGRNCVQVYNCSFTFRASVGYDIEYSYRFDGDQFIQAHFADQESRIAFLQEEVKDDLRTTFENGDYRGEFVNIGFYLDPNVCYFSPWNLSGSGIEFTSGGILGAERKTLEINKVTLVPLAYSFRYSSYFDFSASVKFGYNIISYTYIDRDLISSNFSFATAEIESFAIFTAEFSPALKIGYWDDRVGIYGGIIFQGTFAEAINTPQNFNKYRSFFQDGFQPMLKFAGEYKF